MFQLKKVFVQFLPKIIIYFSKKKISNFFFTIFQVDRQDLLSCKDYLIYHWQNGWRVLRVQIFFFFISYKKNKICNSCFLAKTKREGNEIVLLCWFCQNFSKVHSKCVREKTPLKVDPLEKKLCVFFKRPFDEFLWDKLSIKLQKNESCEPCAFARAQILWHLLDRLVNKIFFEIQFLNIFFLRKCYVWWNRSIRLPHFNTSWTCYVTPPPSFNQSVSIGFCKKKPPSLKLAPFTKLTLL